MGVVVVVLVVLDVELVVAGAATVEDPNENFDGPEKDELSNLID